MTHKEAVVTLTNLDYKNTDSEKHFALTFIQQICSLDGWRKKGRIPLIHIPEVARIIGVKPSEIDDFFIGKDNWVIDWREHE